LTFDQSVTLFRRYPTTYPPFRSFRKTKRGVRRPDPGLLDSSGNHPVAQCLPTAHHLRARRAPLWAGGQSFLPAANLVPGVPFVFGILTCPGGERVVLVQPTPFAFEPNSSAGTAPTGTSPGGLFTIGTSLRKSFQLPQEGMKPAGPHPGIAFTSSTVPILANPCNERERRRPFRQVANSQPSRQLQFGAGFGF